jgi:hypothetical protein
MSASDKMTLEDEVHPRPHPNSALHLNPETGTILTEFDCSQTSYARFITYPEISCSAFHGTKLCKNRRVD